MKEKIEQLSKGHMTYELPHIVLDQEKLALAATKGKRKSATVSIGNEAGVSMKGLVYSSNPKVVVVTNRFVGSENQIELYCNAEYSEVGDVIEGELCFITNCGEITLPYSFKVVPPVLSSIEGAIRNPVQFAALARSNRSEARRLFISREFEDFIAYYEPKSVILREKLLKSPSVDIAMEQFLIATRKKMGVNLVLSESSKNYNVGFSSFSDSVKLSKSNWGYIHLNVTAAAPFIEPETEVIHDDDFVGQEYELKFVIYPERMKPGCNNTSLTISGCGKEAVINISCHLPHENKTERTAELLRQNLVIKSLDNYLAYSMDQIPVPRFVSEAKTLLGRYERTGGGDQLLARLYKALILKISGKESPAMTIINNITNEELAGGSVIANGLWMYMSIGKNDDKKASYLEQLYTLSLAHQNENFLRILLFMLDERCKRNIKAAYDELKSIFDNGCRSPLLYMLTSKIVNVEPLLIKEPDEFALNTVMFALKRNFLSRDAAMHFTQLVLRTRTYLKVYYNCLAFIYERFQPLDTLTAICQMLVKGYRKESRYFRWYEKGVEENIRIPDLYEYYMYSLDRDIEEELDQSVLMYYVYNSKLNDRKLAWLYANIVLHKESNPIVYENYREKLRLFTLQQMREGKAGRIISVLYNDALSDEKAASQYMEYLYKVIFRCEVKCDNPLMKYICVSHKELDEELIVPLINGEAQVDICTEDAVVMMLDSLGNRYFPGEELSWERYLSDDSLLMLAYQSGREREKLLPALAEKARKMRRFDQTSIDIRKQIISMRGVNEVTRDIYLAELVLYFYDHSQDEISDEDLKKLDYRLLEPVRLGKFIGLLIIREQYRLAYKMMNECGIEEVDIKLLEKFVLSREPAELNKKDKTLLDIMYRLYLDGRRHEKILVYLVNFYNGLTSDLFDIWQEAVAAKCATSDFDERLLVQILFTESYLAYGEQVYVHYHRRSKNRVLTKAYFNYLAYKYLISDVPMTTVSMENMKKDAYYENNDIVVMALLKQYANAGELTAEEQEFVKNRLEILNSKGMILPCFMNFARYFRLPEDMDDKIYIEYRSNPSHRITLHLATRQEGKRVVREEPMRNVCYGIFIKELVLFAQETVEYVITDEDGDNVSGTERQVLTGKSDPLSKSKSRFARINAIINARNMHDKSTAVSLLNDYVKNEFAISQLFHEINV